MQLAPAKPMPLPVMPTTGPADWAGVPLATFDWDSAAPRPVFATSEGFQKLDGVSTVEDALAAASRLSYSNGSAIGTTAAAVLQAKDGAFYLATLGKPESSSRNGYFFPRSDNTRVVSVTPHVDALKAVVGGTTWVNLSSTPATPPPAAVDVPG